VPDADVPNASRSAPVGERLGLWVGTAGSLVTILLTAWNAQTKNEIDRREKDLQALEVQLKQRSAQVEESKERVERYKWVLTLLPSLTEPDITKRNFTISLVRLALTKEEAQQLFSGLQLSPNEELRKIGQQGFESIENQELNGLVLQMNANSADQRKTAVAALERDYRSSPTAITRVLELYAPERLPSLSPSGIINGLYYLSATEAEAWTPAHKTAARNVISRLSSRNPGSQTRAALQNLEQFLANPPS
jgi:hypothetical protein